MDLNTALSDSKIAIHLFFNNKFDEAQHILEPWYVPKLEHFHLNNFFFIENFSFDVFFLT